MRAFGLIVSTLVMFLPSTSARAETTTQKSQSEQTADTFTKNSIFAEFGGAGIIYTLNYERRVARYAGIRVGFGYTFQDLEFYSGGSGSLNDQYRFVVPVMLNLLPQSGAHAGELGAGLAIRYEYEKDVAYAGENDNVTLERVFDAYGTGLIGYRYQPPTSGFHLRAGLSVVVGNRLNYFGKDVRAIGALPLPYISLGGCF